MASYRVRLRPMGKDCQMVFNLRPTLTNEIAQVLLNGITGEVALTALYDIDLDFVGVRPCLIISQDPLDRF